MTETEAPLDISVLYVEDEAQTREVVGGFLRRRVKELYEASDGEGGLVYYSQYHPDLVIVDVRMPNMNGLDMLERIKERGKKARSIVTTAFNDESSLMRSIDLGVDCYLKKPVSTDMLARAVRRVGSQILTKRDDDAQSALNEKILSNVSVMMLVLQEERIVYANRALLEFAGETDIESFNANCAIERLFSKSDPNRKYTKWIAELAKTKERSRIVRMRSLKDSAKSGSFVVKADRIDQKDWIIASFADITRIAKERERALSDALTDSLTKIFNRRKFDDEVSREICGKRSERALSIISLDVDRFKEINDNFGHSAGDIALVEIARLVRGEIRKSDIFARIGGEEFAILLPESDLGGASALAEKLRVLIESKVFESIGRITCSFGVAELKEGESADEFVKRADSALYKAKKSGRNCVALDIGL
ncbi:MAG: diguanylate cyclase [Helicobacteraceae bacterium]|jgi:diguanylate cyclase (GGDEF)-like protein|nr:diguanylate cyclase [Helicobacteraceae bacterium]